MSMTSNKWVKFFTEAGLPTNVATKYAIIFTDHRIQLDMLPDLTKDILYDMGIRTIGDVIAIIRHAKNVHDEKVKERMLGESVDEVGTTSKKLVIQAAKPVVRREATPKMVAVAPTKSQTVVSSGISPALAKRLGGFVSDQPKPTSTSIQRQIISLKRPASSTSSIQQPTAKIVRLTTQKLRQDVQKKKPAMALAKPVTRLRADSSTANSSVFSRLGNVSVKSRLGSAAVANLRTVKRP